MRRIRGQTLDTKSNSPEMCVPELHGEYKVSPTQEEEGLS
jgi:hypothetical protein